MKDLLNAFRPIWMMAGDQGGGGEAGGQGGGGEAGGQGGGGEGGGEAGGQGGGGEGGGEAGGQGGGVSTWLTEAPENWRELLVNELPEDRREAAGKVFERIPAMPTLALNYLEAQDKIRSGLPPEEVAWLPKDPTEEQIAEYREKMDIPAEAKDYELSLDDGLVLSDEDRGMFQPIFDVLHAANTPTAVASTLVNEYLKLEQTATQQRHLDDDRDKAETETALKKTWGNDYQKNITLVEAFLADLPESVAESIRAARMGDGKALFNSPEFMMFLVRKQREIDPMATLTFNDGEASIETIEKEIKDIESKMGTPEYNNDVAMQERYRNLIDARTKLAQK